MKNDIKSFLGSEFTGVMVLLQGETNATGLLTIIGQPVYFNFYDAYHS